MEWLTRRLGPPTLPADLPTLPTGAVDLAHYPTYAEVRAFCEDLQAEHPDLVSILPLGPSWQGRGLFVLRLGSTRRGDPDARPALYVDAQHHAREPISQQAALYFAWWLAQRYTQDEVVQHLLNTRTLYVLPLVNPDGNELWLNTDAAQRRTANPNCDDDGDGRRDEDPADEAGYGSHDRFLFRFDATWAADHAGDILAPGWEQHRTSSIYLGFCSATGRPLPQYNNDGDEDTNEDPIGGVDANRNYDLHWELGSRDVRAETYRGPYPFSEPEARAVHDFVASHLNIASAISLHSGTDMILYPWAWTNAQRSPSDAILEEIARKGSQLTACNGYEGTRYGQGSVVLYRASGTSGDWLHAQGIYSWSPEVYGGTEYILVEPTGASNEFIIGTSLAGLFSPPPDEILPLVDRWRHFLFYVLAATPNVGVARLDADEGALWLQLANDGYMPTDVWLRAEIAAGELLTATWRAARADRHWVSIPWTMAGVSPTMTITITSTITAGGRERTVERERLVLRRTGQGMSSSGWWVEGRITPWVDLGAACGAGSWLADSARWSSERYRTSALPVEERRYIPLVLTAETGHPD